MAGPLSDTDQQNLQIKYFILFKENIPPQIIQNMAELSAEYWKEPVTEYLEHYILVYKLRPVSVLIAAIDKNSDILVGFTGGSIEKARVRDKICRVCAGGYTFVRKEYRRKGIGKALLRRFEKYCDYHAGIIDGSERFRSLFPQKLEIPGAKLKPKTSYNILKKFYTKAGYHIEEGILLVMYDEPVPGVLIWKKLNSAAPDPETKEDYAQLAMARLLATYFKEELIDYFNYFMLSKYYNEPLFSMTDLSESLEGATPYKKYLNYLREFLG